MNDSDFGFGGGESSQEEDEEDNNNNNNEGCAALEASALEASALEASALEASALEEAALEEAAVEVAAVEEEEEVADGNGGALIAVQASKMVVQPAPTDITTNNQDTPRNNNNNNNLMEDLLCNSNEDDSDGEGATCWDEEDPMLEESIGDSNDDRVDGVDKGADIQATPQETETKKRRQFTIQQKMSLVRSIEAKMDRSGTSMRQACSDLNLNTKQYTNWKKKLPVMESSCNKKAKSMGIGPPSSLIELKEPLLSFIFELREQGMGVTTHMVVLRAAQLSRTFRERSRIAQYQVVHRFVLHHSLVYQMSTHESQRTPSETREEALDWLVMIRPRLQQPCRHQDFILNMDQTPVPFTFNRKKTLALIGTRTIHVRKSTCNTKRATFAMTVTASGKVLKPLLIFKGKPTGRIVQRKLPTFSNDMLYSCQDNAWMDEQQMILWVNKVIRPYVAECPVGIIPILFLDSYRCHMMDSVVHLLQELGVEVEHIPGGCTSLCQPVDVGVNKPFKNKIREKWEDWMITEGLQNGTTRPPEQKEIAIWARAAMYELTTEVVRNAWRHNAYTWFPPSCDPQPLQPPVEM